MVGPPVGGAAIGLFGLVTTVFADSVSYLLSAVGITFAGANGEREPRPARTEGPRLRAGDLLDGWRHMISSSTTIAVFTALWGVLASLTSPRAGIAIAGVLILVTPFLLPRPRRSRPLSEPAVMPNPLPDHVGSTVR